MPNFNVRRLGIEDWQLALQLVADFLEEDELNLDLPDGDYIRNLLGKPDFYVIVALHGTKVVGGITAYELPMYKEKTKELFIYEVGTHEDYRRQGVMRGIFEFAKLLAKQNGIGQIFVDAEADNQAALDFYLAVGGQPLKAVEFTYPIESANPADHENRD